MRIMRFASKTLTRLWIAEIFLPRIGLRSLADKTRDHRSLSIAKGFHELAVELGGLMIKVGQFLSSRLDILPVEVTAELASLQDEVPAHGFAEVRPIIERELGMSVETAFATFDPNHVAAASLGQAYRATLHADMARDAGFSDVIVKVQRPGIADVVSTDLAALRKIALRLNRIRSVSRRADVPALVDEFAETTMAEIDYRQEARFRERFAENFAGDDRVGIPEIAWERSSESVITLEDVTAIKINDSATIRAAGIDPSTVAHVFASVMYEQFFVQSFFHADPHPGNIFVTPDPSIERGWRLTFIDFGMMGEVTPVLKAGLRKVLFAVVARDGKGLVDAMGDVGVLLPGADRTELQRAMSELFSRFGGMGFGELRDVDDSEFRDFAMEFRDVIRELPFQLPENFLLVTRAASLTSGVCSSLDADYNIWDSLEPYATGLMKNEAAGIASAAPGKIVEVATALWNLAPRAQSIITHVEAGKLVVDTSRLERKFTVVEAIGRRVVSAILFGVLIITGAIIRPDDAVLGTVFMGVSAAPLLHALFSRGPRR